MVEEEIDKTVKLNHSGRTEQLTLKEDMKNQLSVTIIIL